MKRFLLTIVIIFIISGTRISVAQAPAERLIDLRECLNMAIDNSPRLKISQLEQTKLQYRLRETQGRGLPGISLNGSFDDYVNLPTQLIPGEFFNQPGEMIPVQFGTTYNLAGSLEASQLLYNQSYLVAIRMAKLFIGQNKLQEEKAKTDLIFEVAQNFYLIQITRLQINNLRSNLDKLTKAESIARSQYESGFIKKIDLDRITVNKLNIMTELDRLEVLSEQQISMQRYFMGLNPDEPVAFPDSINIPVISVIAAPDLAEHIDIRLAEQQKKIALMDLNQNRAGYFPSLSLIASTSYLNQTNDYYVFGKSNEWFNTSIVGLRLNVPLFEGFQKRSRVSQSKVALEQIKVSEADTKNLLRLQQEDAQRKLANSITSELRQRENQKLAEHVYAVSQEQYGKGLIPLTDLLDAEKALSDAMTGRIAAIVQMKLAELNYLKANGTILNILN